MKKSLFLLLGIITMTGCTQSEILESRSDENVEIKLKSSAMSVEASTRAPFEGTIGNGNTLVAKVLASKATGDYTTTYANGTMTFTDNGTTAAGFATPAYYPADNTDIYFCGLYPSTGWAATQITTTSFSFDGSQDVMAAAEVYSNKDEAKGGTTKTLAFKHLLTQLVIKAVAADAAAVTAWGDLTDITLSKAGDSAPYSAVTVTLATGAAATASAFATTSTAFKFWTKGASPDAEFTGQTKALTTGGEEVAYSMVSPVIADGTTDYTLVVKTANSITAGVTVPVNLKATGGGAYSGDTQGKKFVVTLTFKATEITAVATVQPWTEDGKGEEEIQ